MIHFTHQEIFASILHALIYGAFFSLFFVTLRVLITSLKNLLTLPKYIFKYDKLISNLPKRRYDVASLGGVSTFFAVILFTVGFILLSYFSLDGNIRLYMFVLSFAAFYLSKNAFFDKLAVLFNGLFELALIGVIIVFRCVFYPWIKIFGLTWNKKSKKRDEYQTDGVNV